MLFETGGNNSVLTPRPPACARSKSNSLRLKRDLLCDYDSSVRPVVHHSNQTSVYIALFPICLTLVSDSLFLLTHACSFNSITLEKNVLGKRKDSYNMIILTCCFYLYKKFQRFIIRFIYFHIFFSYFHFHPTI